MEQSNTACLELDPGFCQGILGRLGWNGVDDGALAGVGHDSRRLYFLRSTAPILDSHEYEVLTKRQSYGF